MQKEIKLGEETYLLSSSVFTLIKYKADFGTDLYSDVTKLTDKNTDVSSLLITLTKIIYILALPNMKEQMSYDRFIQLLPVDILEENKLVEMTNLIVELVPKQQGGQNPNAVR